MLIEFKKTFMMKQQNPPLMVNKKGRSVIHKLDITMKLNIFC